MLQILHVGSWAAINIANTVYTSHTHRLPPMSRCRRSMCRRHLKSLVVTVTVTAAER